MNLLQLCARVGCCLVQWCSGACLAGERHASVVKGSARSPSRLGKSGLSSPSRSGALLLLLPLSASMTSRVGYSLDTPPCGAKDEADHVVWVHQDPSSCLLGGEVWPACWAVCHHLQRFLAPCGTKDRAPLTIIELGAGCGLCGLVAAAVSCPSRVILTDESTELAGRNAAAFTEAYPELASVEVAELPWGQAVPPPLVIEPPSVGLIIGCEITPMPSTHAALVSTLSAMCPPGSSACGVFTIDACTLTHGHDGDTYPRVCPFSKTCPGHSFLALVEAAGFRWQVAEAWSANEIKALCLDRRVVAPQGGGAQRRTRSDSIKRDFGATADDVIIVHIMRKAVPKADE